MLTRRPTLLEWLLVVAVTLVGLLLISGFFATRSLMTSKDELLLLEGVPTDIEVSQSESRKGGQTRYLYFTMTGRRFDYSSSQPQFNEVLTAVTSGDQLQIGVAPLPETFFRRGTRLPIYEIRQGDRLLVNYDQVSQSQAEGKFSLLAVGSFFTVAGLVGICVGVRNYRSAGLPVRVPGLHTQQVRATVLISIIAYAIVIGVHIDPKIRAKSVQVFGESLLGIPITFIVCFVESILYLPMPFFFWHGMRLVLQARDDGRALTIGYILAANGAQPDLARSRKMCLLGLMYFAIIVISWIAYSSIKGV